MGTVSYTHLDVYKRQQLTCATVEDEIAFGPENKGLPVDTINSLVDKYAGYVSMEKLMRRPPQALSGGCLLYT